MIVLLDVADDKAEFAMQVLRCISYVRKVEPLKSEEEILRDHKAEKKAQGSKSRKVIRKKATT